MTVCFNHPTDRFNQTTARCNVPTAIHTTTRFNVPTVIQSKCVRLSARAC